MCNLSKRDVVLAPCLSSIAKINLDSAMAVLRLAFTKPGNIRSADIRKDWIANR